MKSTMLVLHFHYILNILATYLCPFYTYTNYLHICFIGKWFFVFI
jgi:hypothetical protein